ncbi:hypothetical protein DPMN_067074 [Dreissena polymorpha]|uniref:Uncharacterized protein n=1 Tax=Dreissena polymorpha TaxID=45954 RepID=A0A9D3YUM7_DREPO|nr:hypothetical protein DPMN_067074 [Dreissena polymorpha]
MQITAFHHLKNALQYHRVPTTPIWNRDLENHCHHHKATTVFHHHLPQEDPHDPLASLDLQYIIREKNKAAVSHTLRKTASKRQGNLSHWTLMEKEERTA